MKRRLYTLGLVFLVMLSICIFSSCNNDGDDNNNPTGPDSSCWPADLPEFGYGELFSIICDDGVFKSAVFKSVANPETVYNNYKTAVKNAGWVFDVNTSNEFVWGAVYDKGTKGMAMIIQKDGSAAQILYFVE